MPIGKYEQYSNVVNIITRAIKRNALASDPAVCCDISGHAMLVYQGIYWKVDCLPPDRLFEDDNDQKAVENHFAALWFGQTPVVAEGLRNQATQAQVDAYVRKHSVHSPLVSIEQLRNDSARNRLIGYYYAELNKYAEVYKRQLNSRAYNAFAGRPDFINTIKTRVQDAINVLSHHSTSAYAAQCQINRILRHAKWEIQGGDVRPVDVDQAQLSIARREAHQALKLDADLLKHRQREQLFLYFTCQHRFSELNIMEEIDMHMRLLVKSMLCAGGAIADDNAVNGVVCTIDRRSLQAFVSRKLKLAYRGQELNSEVINRQLQNLRNTLYSKAQDLVAEHFAKCALVNTGVLESENLPAARDVANALEQAIGESVEVDGNGDIVERLGIYSKASIKPHLRACNAFDGAYIRADNISDCIEVTEISAKHGEGSAHDRGPDAMKYNVRTIQHETWVRTVGQAPRSTDERRDRICVRTHSLPYIADARTAEGFEQEVDSCMSRLASILDGGDSALRDRKARVYHLLTSLPRHDARNHQLLIAKVTQRAVHRYNQQKIQSALGEKRNHILVQVADLRQNGETIEQAIHRVDAQLIRLNRNGTRVKEVDTGQYKAARDYEQQLQRLQAAQRLSDNAVPDDFGIMLQNIPVNRQSMKLSLRAHNDVVAESSLMSTMALWQTLHRRMEYLSPGPANRGMRSVVRENWRLACQAYSRYLERDDRPEVFARSEQGQQLIARFSVRQPRSNEALRSRMTFDQLMTHALYKIAKYSRHRGHTGIRYGTLIQSISSYCSDSSLVGCKSGNERTLMINGRVAAFVRLKEKMGRHQHNEDQLSSAEQEMLGALRDFVANDSLKLRRLEKASNGIYSQRQYPAESFLCLTSTGSSPAIRHHVVGTLDTNLCESPDLKVWRQGGNVKSKQSHKVAKRFAGKLKNWFKKVFTPKIEEREQAERNERVNRDAISAGAMRPARSSSSLRSHMSTESERALCKAGDDAVAGRRRTVSGERFF